MMYIEHTNLEDNLHQILTNRVPTSSSPSASEATAALLARVREAHNSASSALQQQIQASSQAQQSQEQQLLHLNNNSSTPNNYKPQSDWLKRPEPKLLPLEDLSKSLDIAQQLRKKLASLDTLYPIKVDQKLENSNIQVVNGNKDLEDEEEEQYELLQVVDNDQTLEATNTSKLEANRQRQQQEEVDNIASTSHFVIELNEEPKITSKFTQPLPQTVQVDEDEDFEYVVARVPKRKFHESPASQFIETNNVFKRKVRRPVPEAIPIDYHLKTVNLNRTQHILQLPTQLPKRYPRKYSNDSQKYKSIRKEVNGYAEAAAESNYIEDDYNNIDYDSEPETIEATPIGRPTVFDYNYDFYRQQEAQMGLDIINKLKQLFNWSPSTNHYNTVHQERKRKRRSEDWSGESTAPHQIKYRKVENRFPKFIAASCEEDDASEFLPPLTHHNQQRSSKYEKPYSLNNSAQNSRTLLEMSNRRPTSSIDKPSLRKSMFSAPQITQQIIKNTTYADVEFSDDDEPILMKGFGIKPTTFASNKRAPEVFNIPIIRTSERLKSTQQKAPLPSLIEPRTGSILQSSLVPELETRRKPSYAEAVRLNDSFSGGAGRNSISSSIGPTSESSFLLSDLINLRTNNWPNQNRSSILNQERQSEEREKYQQLLEQVVPRLYRSTEGENKLSFPSSTTSATQRKRSGILLGTAVTSTARSSLAANRRSMGLCQSVMKRPPLSSTINLDDESDEDVTITGISHSKPPRSSKTKQSIPTTVIVDDDDISDIIDLGNEERHVLSACAKIQKEQNSILNLCEEKVEKPKKDALPYVEPVNSLQERFSASPHIKDNWLEIWQTKWLERKKSRNDEVKETVKVTEKLTAERRAAEAEIQERLRKFQIVDPELLVVDDFEDVVEEPEFIELTQEHRTRINAAICGPLDQVLVSKFNLNITRRDIHTLCGHNWLNDEVINFYMNLLTERGEKRHDSEGLPTVYAMNTFFVPRLMQAGHAGVKRWTRKVDIFTKDVIPVPVHVGGVHWCMAIIHLKNRSIKYYDSMGTPNPSVLKALEQYLKDESMDKRKQSFNTSDFVIESVQGVPRQMNGSDCGVFSCMFAEYITRNREITFTQQHMEYFRQKMILEIVMGNLLQ